MGQSRCRGAAGFTMLEALVAIVVLAFGVLGIVVGYAPMLAMLVLIPGFPAAFGEAVLSVFERGANIPLDYRWPWTAPTLRPRASRPRAGSRCVRVRSC